MNTQISFLEGEYKLIHIPLDLYASLLQPILQTLLPPPPSPSAGGDDESLETSTSSLSLSGHEAAAANPGHEQHCFLNISITPLEASVVCHTSFARSFFAPLLASLPEEAARTIHLSRNDFLVLSVISAGIDAARRVMELTSPLALAGIPIFFISTYYSDFILVPKKERDKVVKALLATGFELSDSQQGHFVPARPGTSGRSTTPPPPASPSTSNLDELQERVFETLQKHSVTPKVFPDLELVPCSGKDFSPVGDHVYSMPSRSGGGGSSSSSGGLRQPSWLDNIDTRLYTCIVSALASKPRFLSLTLAQDDAPSLLLDRQLLHLFGDTIIGDTEGRHIPIFLDLVSLPLEVTGIVCGVAGRLVGEMGGESSELSYLSTARAGAVMLPSELSKRALDSLGALLEETTDVA